MSNPILQTKLYAPSPHPDLISRRRLIERLNAGMHRKLTLISAAAGFGKSTIASEWITACGRPSAWLSLDEDDSDLNRFLTYFIAALQSIYPDLGAQPLTLLQSAQPPAADAILTYLLNELVAIPEEIFLVLDDYHVLDSPAVDDTLAFLVDRMPPQMHLVITTREDPNLKLASYRARGQMTELRASDLRFTPAESAAFLNQVTGLNLSENEIAALETRTEGWIAGLQMAALSMQERSDISGFIKAFTGSHRFVLDYLAEEVLQQQSEEMRSFLLQTSILDRLSGPLCDAVTGGVDSQRMLLALERGNLFVIPLDDKRHWYRYHHLFADVLQTRALEEYPNEHPSQIPLLHGRASEWYEENGQAMDAIRHAFAAQDFARAANLIELAWPAIPKGIPPATWLGWINSLLADIVRVRPVLSAGAAWMLIDNGELEAAETYLRNAELWLGTESDTMPEPLETMVVVNHAEFESLPQSMAVARAYLALAHDDYVAAAQDAERARSLLREQEYYWRGGAALFLGMAYWGQGALDDAYRTTAESVAVLRMAGNIPLQIVGTTALADIRRIQGRLGEAQDLYGEALALARSGMSGMGEELAGQDAPLLQTTADLFVGGSELYRLQGDLEKATQQVQQGKELGPQQISSGSASRLCLSMARIKESEGDLQEALNQLHAAERLYKRDAVPNIHSIAAGKARIWTKQGRLADALGWARDSGLSVDDALSYQNEFAHITLARILMAQYKSDRNERQVDDAMQLLARLLDAAKVGGRVGSVIELLVLQALIHQMLGNKPLALESLKEALTLAEPEGYVQLFVDEGEPMQTLLAESLTHGANPSFVTLLLSAMGSQTVNQNSSETTNVDANQLLIEPLSTRELEVLRLLATGHTNQAVADELVIAISTVKKHVNNIFGKLGVANRTQAISRARELDIL